MDRKTFERGIVLLAAGCFALAVLLVTASSYYLDLDWRQNETFEDASNRR